MKAASRLWILVAIGLLAGGAILWRFLPRRAEPPPVVAPPSGTGSSAPTVANQDRVRAQEALARGIEWLVRQQSADGGWRSETYGTMKGGGAITAIVVYALSHVPEPLRAPHDARLRRAMTFLTKGVAQRGYVADPDGSSEFPTYATAMTLVAAHRLGYNLAAADRERMIEYLVAAQIGEKQGYRLNTPHYGGWDMVGGPTAALPGATPGTNVSVTSFALEALAVGDNPQAGQALDKGKAWLAGVQNFPGDGGFVFTPARGDFSNKAGWGDAQRTQPRAYATTTCDGLRALAYCGADPAEARRAAAQAWLMAHQELRIVPGFESLPEESPNWREGLRFYYYFSLAKCLPYLPDDMAAPRRGSLIAALLPLQMEDGRWENGWPPAMREDDPLIATPFAVIALAEALAP